MLKYAKIGDSYALNTKKTFILLFDFILPIFKSFHKSPKIAIIYENTHTDPLPAKKVYFSLGATEFFQTHPNVLE